jgi:hypothetical protein
MQLPFAYEPGDAGNRAWLAMLEVLRGAVTFIGPKDFCDEADINKTTLSEALNEQRDRRWAAEWTHVLIAMLDRKHTPSSDEWVKRILDAQTALSTRFRVMDISDEPTPEEIAAAQRVLAKVSKKRAA